MPPLTGAVTAGPHVEGGRLADAARPGDAGELRPPLAVFGDDAALVDVVRVSEVRERRGLKAKPVEEAWVPLEILMIHQPCAARFRKGHGLRLAGDLAEDVA